MITKFFVKSIAYPVFKLGLTLLTLAFLTSLIQAAPSYDKLKRGPKIGSVLPHSLNAKDQTGATRSFKSITGEKGLILLFSRSVGWCVFCKTEAVDWNTRLKDAKALGYEVGMVTYDQVSRIARFTQRQKIGYPILSDPKSKIIKAFDILNEEHQPGSFAYGIPHPIIFVVDPKGTIRHRFSEGKTYSRRPDIDQIFNVLRKSAGSS